MTRRIIYFVMLIAVSFPLITKLTLTPAPLKSAESLYSVIESLNSKTPGVAFLAMDFGPGTKAENLPQAEVMLEHLMRRRIPVIVFSVTPIAEPFLSTIPEKIALRLMKENPDLTWEYGKDWVNIGFQPGGGLFIQALAKSDDLAASIQKDANGTSLGSLPAFKGVKGFSDIKFLGQVTGLVGVLQAYIQFFQSSTYVPPIGHGCTSITIPESYIYLDSGQLMGLLEGVSGAAWYSELLKSSYPDRAPDSALLMNTALGAAQLTILGLILIGNIGGYLKRRTKP